MSVRASSGDVSGALAGMALMGERQQSDVLGLIRERERMGAEGEEAVMRDQSRNCAINSSDGMTAEGDLGMGVGGHW